MRTPTTTQNKSIRMKEYLQYFLNRIEEIGGESEKLIFEEPATEEEVAQVEAALNIPLPYDFKQTLLTVSKHCDFNWFLPDHFELPDELDEIFCGEIHWGIHYLVPFNESKVQLNQLVFANVNDRYDKVWHNKLAFQEVGNGDYLAFDLNPRHYGKIIYLSHDDGEGHGLVMADSFSDLLKKWLPLGCPGAEDWQWLPFYNKEKQTIDPHSPNAQRWKTIIGIE